MPSLAFATIEANHKYAVADPENFTWTEVQNALKGEDAEFVEVVKAPTHSVDGVVDGVVRLTCKGDFCGEVIERAIPAKHDFVNTAMTPEEFANAQKAEGVWDSADVKKFLVTNEASNKYCTITAKKCSCGYVGERVAGENVTHQKPSDLANCATTYV